MPDLKVVPLGSDWVVRFLCMRLFMYFTHNMCIYAYYLYSFLYVVCVCVCCVYTYV